MITYIFFKLKKIIKIKKGAEKMKIDIKKLEILQAEKCMTVKELKKKSGIGHTTYLRIRQRSEKVAPITVGKIAKALNCDVLDIIEK